MSNKFADFLTEKKIDPRRLLAVSSDLEKLRPEDRAIRLAKRQGRGKEKKEGEDATPAKKPRSGRPVTDRLLASAQTGKAITGPAKTRLLRAVNQILSLRKEAAVDLRVLF